MQQATKRLTEAFGYRSSEALFDRIEDTVYFVKDLAGRYASVNNTLVARCGYRRKEALIGRLPQEVMPEALGTLFATQDEKVMAEQRSIQSKLERHLFAKGGEGWCLTWKEPLLDSERRVAGLVGISRDLPSEQSSDQGLQQVSEVLRYVETNFGHSVIMADLAKRAGLSAFQLNWRVRSLLGLTLSQYVTKLRIDHACFKLRYSETPIVAVALECGYADQAAFSRQFRQSVSLSPAAYRKTGAAKEPEQVSSRARDPDTPPT